VSWRRVSKLAFLKTIPVKPPVVKRKIKPTVHKRTGSKLIKKSTFPENFNLVPKREANQLKTLIPVGIAITIVAAEK
jgi:hypothetical protein